MGSVPSFRTWVAGEIVTAAYMNANVRDAGNFMIGEPIAELRQATLQPVATASFTSISLDASDIDSDGGHSNVTNNSRYTGKTAGWFQFSGGASFATNGTGSRGTQWAKNGTGVVASGVLGASSGAAFASWVAARTKFIQLNGSTDYVELQAFQSSGGSLNTVVGAGSDPANMSVRWVHS
jgi:hypothetical protein